MLVIEIDRVHAEPFETGVAAFFDVLRIASHAQKLPLGPAYIAEFRGQNDLVALAADDGLADKDFVSPLAVDVGGVEEVAAQVRA